MSYSIRALAIPVLSVSISLAAMSQASPQTAPDPSELSPAKTASAAGTQPSVVVVLDSSAGSSGSFGQMRDAASRLIQSMGEERDVAVVTASGDPKVLTDFNSEADVTLKALKSIKPHGRPRLQRAVEIAAQRASAESDNAAVVVFARNPDGAATNAQSSVPKIPVYVIASPAIKWKVQAELQQLAVKSGGTAYFPSNDRELRDIVKETATRIAGHTVVDEHSAIPKNLLRGYERIIVREIPMEETSATTEAGGGENLLMQQVLVARIRKAKLFPVVVNGADEHALESASSTPIGNALELRATVVEFRRGNKAQRQFLAGVKGGAKMKLRVVLVDAATNKPVLAFTKQGTYASGIWGGSPEHVQAQAMLNVANEIVNELKRAR